MNQTATIKILPIMFSFFIMGFVDVVGISANYVRVDFNLTDTMTNFLPTMVFIWFAVFSVPSGILMNRIGRKNTVLLSIVLTGFALLIPLISYNYISVLVAFGLLGIANTVLQVALNPLVSNIVSRGKLTSFLTLGQFVKSIASFAGPLIAAFAASVLGNWKLLFPIFAAITVLSGVWLWAVPIKKEEQTEQVYSFKASFSLLFDKYLLLLFIGILAIVGIDVGMNITSPRILMENAGLDLNRAGMGTSVYFAARTFGTLAGAIILSRFSPAKFMKINMLAGIVVMGLMLFVNSTLILFILIALIGFTMANVFSIIFSAALNRNPERMNEISGLMIMGVAGGAILPPLMGVISDWIGSIGNLITMLIVIIFLFLLSTRIKEPGLNH